MSPFNPGDLVATVRPVRACPPVAVGEIGYVSSEHKDGRILVTFWHRAAAFVAAEDIAPTDLPALEEPDYDET